MRKNLPIRGNNTNTFVEAAMRVLKDKVCYRVRAFNVIQLLDFILTRYESYYERRLIDIANNRLDVALSKRCLPSQTKLGKEMIQQHSPMTFTVKSADEEHTNYFVDISIGVCTCPTGNTGAPCKHQYAVVSHYHVSSFNFVPVTSSMRTLLYTLATGCTDIPDGWFAPLQHDNPHQMVDDFSSPIIVNHQSGDGNSLQVKDHEDQTLLRVES